MIKANKAFFRYREKNQHCSHKSRTRQDIVIIGKVFVTGTKDRASGTTSTRAVPETDKDIFQGFTVDWTSPEAEIRVENRRLPITTEMLRYGQRIAVLGLPAHALMRTPEALKVVGPAAFGYFDITFAPMKVA